MDFQQRLIDREIVLARSRFLRTLAQQVNEEADGIRWKAEQERRYSGHLRDCAAQLRLITSARQPQAASAIPPGDTPHGRTGCPGGAGP